MIESLNYTAQRLRVIFPTHFTPTMAQRWAHNEKMIGEIAYGGRMGNAPPPSTDGYDFRGAGLTQVTARDGHILLQKFLDEHWRQGDSKFSILDDPELIIDPEHALECGVADFIVCGCLPFAENNDVVGVTKKLNGGTNGLAERRRQLGLWKLEFGL
jgi:putative chitinase